MPLFWNVREKVSELDSADGSTGKLHDAMEALNKLQDQQNKLNKTVRDNQDYLKQLSDELENMMESGRNISIQDPYGELRDRRYFLPVNKALLHQACSLFI